MGYLINNTPGCVDPSALRHSAPPPGQNAPSDPPSAPRAREGRSVEELRQRLRNHAQVLIRLRDDIFAGRAFDEVRWRSGWISFQDLAWATLFERLPTETDNQWLERAADEGRHERREDMGRAAELP